MFAGLLLAGLVVVGAASGAPITVDSCSFVRAGSFEHSVKIGFHNTSNRTANVVEFEVYNGPHHIAVRDHGTFAPGVSITRTLATPTWELYHAEPHSCVVTYVQFENGSSWSAP